MRNAAYKNSLKNGDIQKMSDREYRGTPPVYQNIETNPLMPVRFVKVKKGIPFVRA